MGAEMQWCSRSGSGWAYEQPTKVATRLSLLQERSAVASYSNWEQTMQPSQSDTLILRTEMRWTKQPSKIPKSPSNLFPSKHIWGQSFGRLEKLPYMTTAMKHKANYMKSTSGASSTTIIPLWRMRSRGGARR